jgi:signal recognition particle receptor subunit beta
MSMRIPQGFSPPLQDLKILFVGPPGAGKTTAIGKLSNVAPVSTEVSSSELGLGKACTTVGLDYGELVFGDIGRVRLFGVPGQARFSFMWDILAPGATGFVLLIHAGSQDPVADLALLLDHFRHALAQTACVVGLSRAGEQAGPLVDALIDTLASRGLACPVLALDVRDHAQVLQLMGAVIAQAESLAGVAEPAA